MKNNINIHEVFGFQLPGNALGGADAIKQFEEDAIELQTVLQSFLARVGIFSDAAELDSTDDSHSQRVVDQMHGFADELRELSALSTSDDEKLCHILAELCYASVFADHNPENLAAELSLSGAIENQLERLHQKWKAFAKKNNIASSVRYDYECYIENMRLANKRYHSACIKMANLSFSVAHKSVGKFDTFKDSLANLFPEIADQIHTFFHGLSLAASPTAGDSFKLANAVRESGSVGACEQLNAQLVADNSVFRLSLPERQFAYACIQNKRRIYDGALSWSKPFHEGVPLEVVEAALTISDFRKSLPDSQIQTPELANDALDKLQAASDAIKAEAYRLKSIEIKPWMRRVDWLFRQDTERDRRAAVHHLEMQLSDLDDLRVKIAQSLTESVGRKLNSPVDIDGLSEVIARVGGKVSVADGISEPHGNLIDATEALALKFAENQVSQDVVATECPLIVDAATKAETENTPAMVTSTDAMLPVLSSASELPVEISVERSHPEDECQVENNVIEAQPEPQHLKSTKQQLFECLRELADGQRVDSATITRLGAYVESLSLTHESAYQSIQSQLLDAATPSFEFLQSLILSEDLPWTDSTEIARHALILKKFAPELWRMIKAESAVFGYRAYKTVADGDFLLGIRALELYQLVSPSDERAFIDSLFDCLMCCDDSDRVDPDKPFMKAVNMSIDHLGANIVDGVCKLKQPLRESMADLENALFTAFAGANGNKKDAAYLQRLIAKAKTCEEIESIDFGGLGRQFLKKKSNALSAFSSLFSKKSVDVEAAAWHDFRYQYLALVNQFYNYELALVGASSPSEVSKIVESCHGYLSNWTKSTKLPSAIQELNRNALSDWPADIDANLPDAFKSRQMQEVCTNDNFKSAVENVESTITTRGI